MVQTSALIRESQAPLCTGGHAYRPASRYENRVCGQMRAVTL